MSIPFRLPELYYSIFIAQKPSVLVHVYTDPVFNNLA